MKTIIRGRSESVGILRVCFGVMFHALVLFLACSTQAAQFPVSTAAEISTAFNGA